VWIAETLAFEPVQLDFTSAGLGPHRDRALVADGVELVNAVRLADLDDEDPVQVIVCRGCGITGCQPGGRVAIRRFGEDVIWLPAFAEMASGEWQMEEYAPPGFMSERGAVLLRAALLEQLEAEAFLARKAAPLSAREAARIVQWEAPGRVLGQVVEDAKLRSKPIAVDAADGAKVAAALDRLLAEHLASDAPVAPIADVEPIAFYLDLPDTPAWSPLARTRDGRLVLNLVAGLAAAIAA
jgi:hypothetical protein